MTGPLEQTGRTLFGLALLTGDAAGKVARRLGEAAATTGGEVVSDVASAVVRRIDLQPIVDQFVAQVDFDPVISKVIDGLDMGPIVDEVMSEMRMGSLVMDATGGLTSDLVGDMREKGVEADALVERLVGKVLRRRLGELPEVGLPGAVPPDGSEPGAAVPPQQSAGDGA